MKTIIITAVAALGLATAVPALAAQDDHHDWRQTHQSQPQHTGPGSQQHGPDTHRDMPKPPPVRHEDHSAPPIHHETTTTHMPPPPVVKHDTRRYDWNKYQQHHTPPRAHAPKLDFRVWHRNFEAPRHFHREPYHRPHNWYYRRWVFGMVLPDFFWTRDYWITDYWNYDLPDPPYGYVWVREGDDALLVNVSSGYILQVVYDLFD